MTLLDLIVQLVAIAVEPLRLDGVDTTPDRTGPAAHDVRRAHRA